jgi:hypothetical protein
MLPKDHLWSDCIIYPLLCYPGIKPPPPITHTLPFYLLPHPPVGESAKALLRATALFPAAPGTPAAAAGFPPGGRSSSSASRPSWSISCRGPASVRCLELSTSSTPSRERLLVICKEQQHQGRRASQVDQGQRFRGHQDVQRTNTGSLFELHTSDTQHTTQHQHNPIQRNRADG